MKSNLSQKKYKIKKLKIKQIIRRQQINLKIKTTKQTLYWTSTKPKIKHDILDLQIQPKTKTWYWVLSLFMNRNKSIDQLKRNHIKTSYEHNA